MRANIRDHRILGTVAALLLVLTVPFPGLGAAMLERPQETYVYEGDVGPTGESLLGSSCCAGGSSTSRVLINRLPDGRVVVRGQGSGCPVPTLLDSNFSNPTPNATGISTTSEDILSDGFRYQVLNSASCAPAPRCLVRKALDGTILAILAREGTEPNDFPVGTLFTAAADPYVLLRAPAGDELTISTYRSDGTLMRRFQAACNQTRLYAGTGRFYCMGQAGTLLSYDYLTGNYLESIPGVSFSGGTPAPLFFTSFGDRIFTNVLSAPFSAMKIVDPQLQPVGGDIATPSGAPTSMIFVDQDTAYVASRSCGTFISRYRRAFRTLGPVAPSKIPTPEIVSVTKGSSQQIVVTYRVLDDDSPAVDVRALGLLDDSGATGSLRQVVSLQAMPAEYGASVTTGTTHTFAWDAVADIGASADFADVRVALYAKDERGLLDVGYIRLPAGVPDSGDPELVISRSPVSGTDMMRMWYWLLAQRDPAIALANGNIVGASGPFTGQVLASGTSTSAEGTAFLFARLAVRAATQAEVDRAREWTSIGVQSFSPPATAVVGPLPGPINEIGFSIQDGGIWIVPSM